MDKVIIKFRNLVGEKNVFIDENMSLHTSFKTGGKAKAVVVVHSDDQLMKALQILSESKIKHLILGNGSNTLFSDSGYSGVVVKLGDEFGQLRIIPTEEVGQEYGIEPRKDVMYVEAGASALLSTVGKFALKESLTGFEFASGIPGSVGGGVFMNAGAYDGELKDILVGVNVVVEDGSTKKILKTGELDLGYRHSAIQESKDIVTSAIFELTLGDKEQIKAKMNDLTNRRNTKQPVQYPSCGSFFKRPAGYFAGKLVQDAGFKGYSVGGAQVSEQHSGFIINTGNATATDIINLMKKIQKGVKDKFGVDLEPEVRIIGD